MLDQHMHDSSSNSETLISTSTQRTTLFRRVKWITVFLIGLSILVGYLSRHAEQGSIWTRPFNHKTDRFVGLSKARDELVVLSQLPSRYVARSNTCTTYTLSTGAKKSSFTIDRDFTDFDVLANESELIFWQNNINQAHDSIVRYSRQSGSLLHSQRANKAYYRVLISPDGKYWLSYSPFTGWVLRRLGEERILASINPPDTILVKPGWSGDAQYFFVPGAMRRKQKGRTNVVLFRCVSLPRFKRVGLLLGNFPNCLRSMIRAQRKCQVRAGSCKREDLGGLVAIGLRSGRAPLAAEQLVLGPITVSSK